MWKLFKFITPIFPFWDFVYVLQLEEYHTARFISQSLRMFFRRRIEKRARLVLTVRAKATLLLSVLLVLLDAALELYLLGVSALVPTLVITAILAAFLAPLYIAVANVILSGLFRLAHWYLERKAVAMILKKHPNLQVIAITGSYGKTTTKYFIYELLKHTHKVQLIEGTINTAPGIAAWIRGGKLQKKTEVLIVETGAYVRGDIKRAAKIFPPDVAVVTALAPQHIERFGTFANLVKAKWELIEAADNNKGLTFAPKNVVNKFKKHNLSTKTLKSVDISTFIYKEHVSLLRSHPQHESNVVLATEVAKHFEVPDHFIKDTLAHLELPNRRSAITKMYGFTVIDDSYNINPDTARKSVEAAKAYAEDNGFKKLVVLTAGIPEQGNEASKENAAYGKFLRANTDEVVVLKSIFHEALVGGCKNKETLSLFTELREVWKYIQETHSPKETLVLFQPELTDLHY